MQQRRSDEFRSILPVTESENPGGISEGQGGKWMAHGKKMREGQGGLPRALMARLS